MTNPTAHFIVSINGGIMEISREALEMSEMAQAALRAQNDTQNKPIDFFVEAATAKLIVEYCETFKQTENDGNDDQFFFGLSEDKLRDLVTAADFLQIPRLYGGLCAFIAKNYSNKRSVLADDEHEEIPTKRMRI